MMLGYYEGNSIDCWQLSRIELASLHACHLLFNFLLEHTGRALRAVSVLRVSKRNK